VRGFLGFLAVLLIFRVLLGGFPKSFGMPAKRVIKKSELCAGTGLVFRVLLSFAL
jgi:hypothetical protein